MASARRRLGAMRAFYALRLFRGQMKKTGHGDMLSYIVAALVALRTYRTQKRAQQEAESRQRTSMREVLRG